MSYTKCFLVDLPKQGFLSLLSYYNYTNTTKKMEFPEGQDMAYFRIEFPASVLENIKISLNDILKFSINYHKVMLH